MVQRVLVVEDDAELRSMVQLLLEESGYEVMTAENGKRALEQLAERGPPELILLDMRMPVMNGWEFARQYRASGYPTPILVVTAAAHAAQFAEEIEANGFLSKPFSLDELLEAVKLHLDN